MYIARQKSCCDDSTSVYCDTASESTKIKMRGGRDMAELETDRVKKLKAKRAEIDALLRQEQQKLSEEARKQDRNRKILQGACAELWAKEDSDFATKFMARLDSFLIRNRDRALFGMRPLPGGEKDERPSAH